MKTLTPIALLISSLLVSPLLLAGTAPDKTMQKNPSTPKNAAGKNYDNTLKLEKILTIARRAKPGLRVISTFESVYKGREVDQVFYMPPKGKETRIMSIDSLSGEVVEDHPYDVPEKQASIPLESLVAKLRETHHIHKIIRTRLTQRDGRFVRIIIYVDNLKQQRLMVVDTKTGKVISDKARKFS